MAAGVPLGERILQGQGPEFAELLEALDEAITVRDRDDRFVYANRTALRTLDMGSLDELVGTSLQAVLDRFSIVDARGRPVPYDAIPSVGLLQTGIEHEPLLVRMVARATGEVGWRVLKASPLRNPDGTVAGVVTIIEDVTAMKEAEIHTRVLAESGRLLSASLEEHETLRNIAQAALGGFADWCLVELVDGRRRGAVVVAHVDPDMEPLARRLRALEPPEPAPGSALERAIESGEPALYEQVADAHLERVAVSDEQLDVLRQLRIRSAIVAPMRVPSRTLGAMSFFTSSSQRRFTTADVAVAAQLAGRAAVAMENAHLHTTLTDVAATLQQSLRPAPLPDVAGWEIGALYRPALADRRVEVGGDFYEVFTTGGAAFAMIGDVTGHGVAAATMTSLMRYGARFASHLEPDPVAIVRRLDEELRRRAGSALCTTLCASLQDESVILCSAGHPPALIVQSGGVVTEAPGSGPLLGAFPDSSWHQERVAVTPGTLVLLYTDGVIEAAAGRERFGTGRLRELVSHHAGSAPQALLHALEAELTRFCGGPPADDVAALALRPRRRSTVPGAAAS